MIDIKLYHVTEIATNCCYLVDEATGKSAVTDPGAESNALISQIEKDGGRLDSWDEFFKADRWYAAFEKNGLDPAFYANRTRPYDEVMPWDHIDYMVSKAFLIRENEKAHQGIPTPSCRLQCGGDPAGPFRSGCQRQRDCCPEGDEYARADSHPHTYCGTA